MAVNIEALRLAAALDDAGTKFQYLELSEPPHVFVNAGGMYVTVQDGPRIYICASLNKIVIEFAEDEEDES